MNSSNSWTPYYTYRDCSQGICSLYCPQWCYLIYPPPPFSLTNNDDDYPFNFSPLVIAIIGILSSAILLIAYYTILSKYCRRRRATNDDENQVFGLENNQVTHLDHYQASLVGLDEATIKSIQVYKYKMGDGSCDKSECSVCLSEFQENEDLKLLPKCDHYFHVMCIDTWLKTHSNCPLCRANIVSNNPIISTQIISPNVGRDDDVVLVVENGLERENVESREERSNSLSVADILRIRDDDEDIEMGIRGVCSGVGSSRGDNLMKNS